MARTDKKEKYKEGQKVSFVCKMGRTVTGKIVKKSNKWMIETKDRFYYLNKVTLI